PSSERVETVQYPSSNVGATMRREFLKWRRGCVAAAAGTQQPSMPGGELLNTSSPEAYSERPSAFPPSPKNYPVGTQPDPQTKRQVEMRFGLLKTQFGGGFDARMILVLAAAFITIATTLPVSAQTPPPITGHYLSYEQRNGQWFVRTGNGDCQPLSTKACR